MDCSEVVLFYTFHIARIIWKHVGWQQVTGQVAVRGASTKYGKCFRNYIELFIINIVSLV